MRPTKPARALHHLSVEPELAAIDQAEAEHDDEARPDRPELDEAPQDDRRSSPRGRPRIRKRSGSRRRRCGSRSKSSPASRRDAQVAPEASRSGLDRAAGTFVVLAAQVDHARDEGRRPHLAEAAARAERVLRAGERLVVLHREERPAGLARRIPGDPLDADLVGEGAAAIDEAHPDVVALDERLDERAVAVAVPDAPGAVDRLLFASRRGCRRKCRSWRRACSA